ncbi:transmembrane protein 26-like [Genypterus blacodes]|uniref:transmembrane protein 26-like n=1 Tax=Genypterus blacodes TaxID=154954 RepID=UPI003F76E244
MIILMKFTCAVITRALFVLVSLMGVWRVTRVKKDPTFWLLTVLFVPLVVELIITLARRRGKDYKWFSPAILLFLISIIPSIWILELHHQLTKASEPMCKKLDSWRNILTLVRPNQTEDNPSYQTYLKSLSTICADDWILVLHQTLLIQLILGKWLLPLGAGVSREALSQLLLIFVGTAADILEFTSETLSDVKDNSPQLVYIILAVWSWSMLQFPFHVTVVTRTNLARVSILAHHSTDMWSIVETLFIQDGPFMVVRVTVMTYYGVFHQMLVFFTIKNFLVVILNLYRLVVLCQSFSEVHAGLAAAAVPLSTALVTVVPVPNEPVSIAPAIIAPAIIAPAIIAPASIP